MSTIKTSGTILPAVISVVENHPFQTLGVSIFLYVFVYGIFYKTYLYPRYFSPLRNIPGPPLGSWYRGQYDTIIREEAAIPQKRWRKEYGPVVRAVGPVGIERLIFTKPAALKQILSEDWVDYPRPRFLRYILGYVAGFGLLTVTGNAHKQMRKVMNPAFSMSALMQQMDMYHEPIETLISLLHKELAGGPKVIKMAEWMNKVTLDIICLTAFGYETNSLKNHDNPLAVSYESALALQSGENLTTLIAVMLLPLSGGLQLLRSNFFPTFGATLSKIYPRLWPAYVLTKSMRTIKAISREFIKEKLADASVLADDEKTQKKDIMSILLRSRLSESSDAGFKIADTSDMEDQVLTFLGAGHETTASGLAWTLWLLANNQDVQDKLRTECAELLEKNSRPDYREIKELSWLDCVINESLRVIPPVPMTFREAGKDGYIDGTFVPKGTILYIPIKVVNHSTELWGEDAEEFKPERWYNLPKDYSSTWSVLTFIAGPHQCIGKTMSIIEMKTILAPLIANFKFDPTHPGQTVKSTAAITMKPADDMPLRVTPVVKK